MYYHVPVNVQIYLCSSWEFALSLKNTTYSHCLIRLRPIYLVRKNAQNVLSVFVHLKLQIKLQIFWGKALPHDLIHLYLYSIYKNYKNM